MAASMTERTTDSKNRKFAPALVSIFVDSKVEEGDTVSSLGKIEVDSYLYDRDVDGGKPTAHERKTLDLALAVQLEVCTPEEAAALDSLIRRLLNSIDYMEENKPTTTPEE